MPVEILMPRVAPAMQDGTVVVWRKQEGDTVKAGEIVVEITAEKASAEVEAQAEGVLYKILAEPGDVVPVYKPLAVIRLDGDTTQDLAPYDGMKHTAAIVVAGKSIEIPSQASEERIKASPLAKRIAREEGVDLAAIKAGSGPGGRITEQDVREYLAARTADPGEPAPAAAISQQSPQDTRLKVSAARRETANRLRLSKDNCIPVTSVTEVDLTELIELYRAIKPVWQDVHAINPTLNAFFLKAVALGLRQHKMLNATLDGDEIVVKGSINIGLAMNDADALYVPVIKQADTLSVTQIAAQIAGFVQKMQNKELTIADMTDGTFTVTNVGPFDVQFSTPVIVYPQVGILGIGKVNDRAVFQGDVIVKRKLCYLSLTYDHRVVDGVPAALFRTTVKNLLEKPLSLLN